MQIIFLNHFNSFVNIIGIVKHHSKHGGTRKVRLIGIYIGRNSLFSLVWHKYPAAYSGIIYSVKRCIRGSKTKYLIFYSGYTCINVNTYKLKVNGWNRSMSAVSRFGMDYHCICLFKIIITSEHTLPVIGWSRKCRAGYLRVLNIHRDDTLGDLTGNETYKLTVIFSTVLL